MGSLWFLLFSDIFWFSFFSCSLFPSLVTLLLSIEFLIIKLYLLLSHLVLHWISGSHFSKEPLFEIQVVAAEKASKGGMHEKLTMTVAVPLLWGVPPASETLHVAVRSGGGIVDKVYWQWDFLWVIYSQTLWPVFGGSFVNSVFWFYVQNCNQLYVHCTMLVNIIQSPFLLCYVSLGYSNCGFVATIPSHNFISWVSRQKEFGWKSEIHKLLMKTQIYDPNLFISKILNISEVIEMWIRQFYSLTIAIIFYFS